MDPAHHPIYARLTATQDPFSRHIVLHELEQRLAARSSERALAQRVKHFIDRGVPYFAPADRHYRHWAEQAAELWEAVGSRDISAKAVSGA